MKKKSKRTLTPKLRFPEFREQWGEVHLSQLVNPVADRVGTNPCIPYTVTSGVGLVSQEEKFGRTIAGNSLKNYISLQKGDFAYNKSATKAYPEGYIARYLDDAKAAVPNSIFTCFRVDSEEVDPAYLDFLFAGNLHGRWLRKFLTIGARAHGSLNVNDDDLMAMPVPLPPAGPKGNELAEQQKIAECLSSLDGLIDAEGRTLEALKAHKKGLMQQLFPQPGQTQPRLRFPEFRDKGEWVEARLGQLGKLVSGLTYSPKDVRDNGLLVLRSSNIQNGEIALDDCVYVTPTIKGANLAKTNDILICVRNGSKPLIGKNAMIPDGIPKCTHGAFMTVLRAHAARFVFQLLQTSAFRKQVAADLGATINSINGSNLLKYRFIIPAEPLEQKRIADCLTALDTQITTQAAKIDALKTHKSGLMQQLFPAPEEQ